MATINVPAITLGIGARNDDVFRNFRTAMVPPAAEAPRGAAVRILATGGGTGVLADAFVGTRPVLERSELSQQTRSPVEPEDVLVDGEPGRPLERISMSLDNQSGAARTVLIRLIIKEL